VIASQIDLTSTNDISGILAPSNGGTGVNGATAPNGAILIGNGSGYTLATLTAGNNIGITNAAGSITIHSTGGGTLTGSGTTNYLAKWSSTTGLTNSQLLDDGTNVGIGTSSLGTAKFSVMGGNVGIGTSSPSQKLDVNGNLNVGGTGFFSSTKVGILLDKDSQPGTSGQVLSSTGTGVDWIDMPNTGIGGSGTANYLPVWTGANTLGNSVIWQSAGALYLPGSGIWSSSGNVGIGTTNPIQKLHVLGNCVTGDTLLPIRRRKKKSNSSKNDEEEFIWEYLLERIDKVLPGDEALSLNEETGEFEYAKIKNLMDKGVQEIYEITTKSGKKIKTTGEHPYLTLMN